MALRPTIYKISVNLSDLDRQVYETCSLTLAQHPSEKPQRMMARLLAYCLNAQEGLAFTKGLSEPDVPDIWARSLDDQLLLWLDVGEPAAERIKKATRIAKEVKVYSFNSKSSVWWEQVKTQFSPLSVSVIQFDSKAIDALAGLVQRTMELSITINGESAFVAAAAGECEINWRVLM